MSPLTERVARAILNGPNDDPQACTEAAINEVLGDAAQLVLDARETVSKDEAQRLRELAQRILDLGDAP